MLKFLIILLIIPLIYTFNLCIIGGSSGLGKELIYQSCIDKNIKVLALTNNPDKITTPCRVNSFTEIKNQPKFNHPNLRVENYWDDLTEFNYDHLIFTTSAKPFENDYSDKLMNKILAQISDNCKSISLISAFGVGDSLKKGNLGISAMNAWYLKDVYRAKNEQEEILKRLDNKKINKLVYRPKALSYGETLLDSTSRKDLANEILSSLGF